MHATIKDEGGTIYPGGRLQRQLSAGSFRCALPQRRASALKASAVCVYLRRHVRRCPRRCRQSPNQLTFSSSFLLFLCKALLSFSVPWLYKLLPFVETLSEHQDL
ncbi:hypothetical protein HPB50_004543 [Hyalomma asiaticum]|uniref:Uncharacterized protein n=1 Tax=Hyalomma asiaticum TaxID=266040 RepID=A0ACB7S0A5_HYAAI|nr:hypothetical protein HPB50_004543 [Hyalomma asiaticum]